MSINSSQPGQQHPVQQCFHNENGKDLVSLVQVCLLLRGFFFKQTCVALGSGRWRISRQLGPCISRNLIMTQYPHLWGRTNVGLAQTTEPPGHKPLVVNVVVVGLFEDEEEGIGVTSNVVKVTGEDPDTPGYQRGYRVKLGRRRSRIVGASPLARSRWSPGTVHKDSPISVP